MHEAALAQSIIDIAENAARKHAASQIKKIKLKLGEFRGVVKEALEFSFEALRRDTLASNAELEVETIRLRVECVSCGEIAVSMNDFNLLCPTCGDPLVIVAGREMQVEYIDLE